VKQALQHKVDELKSKVKKPFLEKKKLLSKENVQRILQDKKKVHAILKK
jgi:hypothetical protein